MKLCVKFVVGSSLVCLIQVCLAIAASAAATAIRVSGFLFQGEFVRKCLYSNEYFGRIRVTIRSFDRRMATHSEHEASVAIHCMQLIVFYIYSMRLRLKS
jgi:hypothetical protein